MGFPKGYVIHRDVRDRFLQKVVASTMTGCWIWSGKMWGAYGRFILDGRWTGAHRAAYELARGPIPAGLAIDHLCRVPRCVNPLHLEPVTVQENTARGIGTAAVALRTDHCVHGHEFTPTNTRRSAKGYRTCRACERHRWHRRAAAAAVLREPEEKP